MTKRHHPHDRAERLRLKNLHEKKTEEFSGKVQRKLLQTKLKSQEAQDDLQDARDTSILG